MHYNYCTIIITWSLFFILKKVIYTSIVYYSIYFLFAGLKSYRAKGPDIATGKLIGFETGLPDSFEFITVVLADSIAHWQRQKTKQEGSDGTL